MTGGSRLLSVRLQGFKSFAERTHLAFGPGISAVVGPNGSGKSNLADALRWALGEQGRALRSRKAEDVIWAGSERRPALGMADVQLVIDNADGLLAVEYGVVELGRRLYRSGENDYLLNRQRVRLRDLVDLLDGAHLADNAFLFIGQGMVDQALALRPEERRPLFEEVAGVRRHERRRRRAEEQLAESEANLARVDDILGELRPQARRLAAQAEQQTSRRSAGDELAAAILAVAHARWHAAAGRIVAAGTAERDARAALEMAMRELGEHETTITELAAGLRERSLLEGARRTGLEVAQARLTELRVRAGRTASDLAGVIRDRNRITTERPELEAAIARAGEIAGRPLHVRDLGLETELAEAERALVDALGEGLLGDAAGPDRADVEGEEAAAIRRLESAHRAEVETARRRLAEAERTLAAEAPRARASATARDAAVAARDAADRDAAATRATIEPARIDRAAAETAVANAEAAASTLAALAAAATARGAGLRARLESAERLLAEEDRDGFAIAATQRGGRRLGDELVVEPELRAAARAALAGLDRAFVVRRDVVADLGTERGTAVVAESEVGLDRNAAVEAFEATVRRRGGGLLREAIRRDEHGIGGRLLARAAWLPDLASCLDLQSTLPAGWISVPRDGRAVVGELVVRLGPAGGRVDVRAEVEGLRAASAQADTETAGATSAADQAAGDVVARRAGLEAARAVEAEAIAALRTAEERSRAAASAADGAAREAAWLEAQVARVRAEADRLRNAVEPRAVAAPPRTANPAEAPTVSPTSARDTAWNARTATLQARRDRLATLVADGEQRGRQADNERAGAETALTLGRTRLAALDELALETVEREARLEQERLVLEREVAVGEAAERSARDALDALLHQDAVDRARLATVELEAGHARERLTVAQLREQATERESLEARLGLEAVREQVLVELTGLGAIGLRHLGAAQDGDDVGAESGDDEAQARLAAALGRAGQAWAATAPADAPGPSRLAALRRRFHELGAGNPDAVEEYAALKARLDELEAQRLDLDGAIDRTRTLIVELDTLIATQFRTTFAALETAFEARFKQLFGGGFARLSLTDPGDLSATGVEIVARPPGKKPQPLAMLSGGERALTAVALLFAMLEVRPVPFCVLDEVDAALDEANIGRFTDALRELSRQTQCIVITHNRGTIEVADALYGVTVGEDSVSRVISLRLEEATSFSDTLATPV
jgi:chromosome segregation protein